eukprot:jgi/Mesvir1/27346/Mv07161-RA.1
MFSTLVAFFFAVHECRGTELATWLFESLHEAAHKGDWKRAKELLINGSSDVNCRDRDGATPLHWAIGGDCLSMVQMFIEYGADVRAVENRMGNTPLHLAAYHKLPKVAELLIDYGADVNAVTSKTRNTPLHLAAMDLRTRIESLFGITKSVSLSGQMETVRLLLHHGADIRAKNANGKTAFNLAFAAKLGDVAEAIATWREEAQTTAAITTLTPRDPAPPRPTVPGSTTQGGTIQEPASQAPILQEPVMQEPTVRASMEQQSSAMQQPLAITANGGLLPMSDAAAAPTSNAPPTQQSEFPGSTVAGPMLQGTSVQQPPLHGPEADNLSPPADANGRGLATDDRAFSPRSLTDPDDREIFFLQYFAEMQLVAQTQAIHRALVDLQIPLTTMQEVRLGMKSADQEMRDLEREYEQSKQLLHQMAAGVKEDPTFEPAVTARNEALTRYQVSLKSLEAVCGKKADLCKTRLTQKRLLRAVQDACRGMEVEGEPCQLSSEADIETVLGKVGQAMDECKKTLEPSVQATQEALKQLQLCLERQHAAAQQVKPWLMEACSLAGPVIHKAVQAMEQEYNGPAMNEAKFLRTRLHAEGQELAGLVLQHETLKDSELKMGLLLRDLQAESDRAKRLRLEVELAAGKEGGAGSRQEELAATERRQHELEEKRQALLVSVTNTQFLKLFPEADLSPEKADQLSRDPWVASLRKLSASLLQVDPSKRPSVDDALSDPDGFLARDLAQAQQAHERHMHAQRLVGVRQEELEALRKGFLSLCNLLEDELKLLTGQGMATLFFGQEYVDVDKAIAAFEFSEEWEPTQVAAAESDDEWWVEEPPCPASKEDASKWLRQFIREASETGLRLLGLRAFGSIHGLANGRPRAAGSPPVDFS